MNFKPLDDVLETITIETEVQRLTRIAKRLDRHDENWRLWRERLEHQSTKLVQRRQELLSDLRAA